MNYISKICLFPHTSSVPTGWARCNGQNGTPNIEPLICEASENPIGYIICTDDNRSSDTFIGQIIAFSGNSVPKGWAKCDGSLRSSDSDGWLYMILSNYYGGDPRTDKFALPKLESTLNDEGENKAPIIYLICTKGIYPQLYLSPLEPPLEPSLEL